MIFMIFVNLVCNSMIVYDVHDSHMKLYDIHDFHISHMEFYVFHDFRHSPIEFQGLS